MNRSEMPRKLWGVSKPRTMWSKVAMKRESEMPRKPWEVSKPWKMWSRVAMKRSTAAGRVPLATIGCCEGEGPPPATI